MSIERALRREAEATALRFGLQADAFEREVAALQQKVRDVEAKRDAALDTARWLKSYTVGAGAEYQCPCCWIIRHRTAPLRPLEGTPRGLLLTCDECHTEIAVPA